MLANRGDKRFSVAREVRVAPRDNTHLHVLFNFKGNRDDVFAVELVRDHARAHVLRKRRCAKAALSGEPCRRQQGSASFPLRMGARLPEPLGLPAP